MLSVCVLLLPGSASAAPTSPPAGDRNLRTHVVSTDQARPGARGACLAVRTTHLETDLAAARLEGGVLPVALQPQQLQTYRLSFGSLMQKSALLAFAAGRVSILPPAFQAISPANRGRR